jgi:hypothetical protein
MCDSLNSNQLPYPSVQGKRVGTGTERDTEASQSHTRNALAPPAQGGAADVMVGMEQVVSEIIGLLQAQSEGRVVLLLHGLVGVGKTAAARATFERIGRGLVEGVLAHWVGLRPGLSTSELLERQRSMRWTLAGHTTTALAAIHTLEDGRSGLRQLLEGRKALLVVDGVS